MALTQERIGQIAMLALKSKMKDEGIRLDPKGIKRGLANEAKKLGVTPAELAELAKIVFKEAFDETMAELDVIILKA